MMRDSGGAARSSQMTSATTRAPPSAVASLRIRSMRIEQSAQYAGPSCEGRDLLSPLPVLVRLRFLENQIHEIRPAARAEWLNALSVKGKSVLSIDPDRLEHRRGNIIGRECGSLAELAERYQSDHCANAFLALSAIEPVIAKHASKTGSQHRQTLRPVRYNAQLLETADCNIGVMHVHCFRGVVMVQGRMGSLRMMTYSKSG